MREESVQGTLFDVSSLEDFQSSNLDKPTIQELGTRHIASQAGEASATTAIGPDSTLLVVAIDSEPQPSPIFLRLLQWIE